MLKECRHIKLGRLICVFLTPYSLIIRGQYKEFGGVLTGVSVKKKVLPRPSPLKGISRPGRSAWIKFFWGRKNGTLFQRVDRCKKQ